MSEDTNESELNNDDLSSKDFGIYIKRRTYTLYGDYECYNEYKVSGFKVDGHPNGYVWIETDNEVWEDHEDEGAQNGTSYSCGIVDDDYIHLSYGVDYSDRTNSPRLIIGSGKTLRERFFSSEAGKVEIPKELLIEKDDQGRAVFCGMQKDGLRHGLGTEFQWEGDHFSVFKGYWEGGKLTHKVNHDNIEKK